MGKIISLTSDPDMWMALKGGDEQAYEEIYTKFSPVLFNYGLHLVKDRQLVEDCLHDLFVQLYERRSTLGKTNSIKFYLFRSLRRKIGEAVVYQRKYANDFENGKGFEVVSSPESLLIEAMSSQLKDRSLVEAINQLPKRQREALYLLYFTGLSYPEIASVMSLQVRTVYNQVHNALENLKKILVVEKALLTFILATLYLLSF